eukprot:2975912-Pyramimonas_sp.AAC.1
MHQGIYAPRQLRLFVFRTFRTHLPIDGCGGTCGRCRANICRATGGLANRRRLFLVDDASIQ